MTNTALLREIHRDNKAINRNLQRLANIGLIGLLGKCAEEAKTGKEIFAVESEFEYQLLLVSHLLRINSLQSDNISARF